MTWCARGAIESRLQRFEGAEQRPQCPMCSALGLQTTADGWHRFSPEPARPTSLPFGRQALAMALWLVAAGFALLAVSSFLAFQNYRNTLHLTTTDAAGYAYLAMTVGHGLVAVGCVAAASIVKRR